MSSPDHAGDAQAPGDSEEGQSDFDGDSTEDGVDATSMVKGIRAMRDGEFATVEELREAESDEQG